MELKEPFSRAMWSCGLSGFELKVSRMPKVKVSFRVAFQVSCAYKSRLRKRNGSFADRGKVWVAVVATP